MPAPINSGPRTVQVVLGLFVVWQLVFLIAANLVKLLDHFKEGLQKEPLTETLAPGWSKGEGHIHDAEEVLTGLTRRWSQLTGQPQNWSLFAPNVAVLVPFVAVECRWDDDPGSADALARDLAPLAAVDPLQALALMAGAWEPPRSPERWLSDNDPLDITHFFRAGRFRLRKYEDYLYVTLSRPNSSEAGLLDGWREEIEKKVNKEGETILAYLRWRWLAWQRRHTGQPPPKQVVLLVRVYRIPAPEPQVRPWRWQDVHVNQPYPVARWRPEVEPRRGYLLPIEMYHPVIERYEYVR
jgi:hypothetical protein